jgi:Protein of unknown function (DUF2934)
LIDILNAEPGRKSVILIFPERQFLPLMARKTNTESKQVISAGASSSPRETRPRRTATTTRSKHSVPAAPETETNIAVSNISEVNAEPSRDEIARLAYVYWLDRGCQNGSAEDDWLRAEQHLRHQSIA